MTLISNPRSVISNATADGTNLCDAVTVKFGPRAELSRFFLLADAMARRVGFYIRIHANLEGLATVNAQLRENWGPLVPTLDPRYSDLVPSNSYWLSAHNLVDDDLIAVCAARRFESDDSGVTEEFRSLRLFYRNPEDEIAKGTRCTVEGLALEETAKVQGVSVYTGAQWTDPGHRGKGIVYILGRVNRNLAFTRWNTMAAFGVFRRDLSNLGVMRHYGFQEAYPLIQMTNSYRGDFSMHFVWMDRLRIEKLLRDQSAEMEGNLARVVVTTDSKIPTESFQGSISRS